MTKLLINFLVALNMGEGIIHIVTALISFWGMFDTGVWDWRIMTAPSFDLLLGIGSIITSIILGRFAGCCGLQHKKCEKCACDTQLDKQVDTTKSLGYDPKDERS